MGNKFTKRRPVVDERFTRPQGLYHHKDVDQKKLRRLILDAKLAPCYPGAEDPATDLDECPICFLFYPSLNRSKCCTKGICTECFLQMKTPHASRTTQCPFCKTPSYAVEYRGAKTVEEKGVEQAEEQKVIEAKIRIRQKELQDECERMLRREEDIQEDVIPASSDLRWRNFSNLHGFPVPSGSAEVDRAPIRDSIREGGWGYEESHGRWLEGQSQVDRQASSVAEGNSTSGTGDLQQDLLQVSSLNLSASERTSARTHMGNTSMHGPAARAQGSSFTRFNRDDEFDLDLEDIMVIEAIWLSIQEQGPMDQDSVSTVHGNLGTLDYARTGTHQNPNFEDDHRDAHPPVSAAGDSRDVPGRGTVTGGLAGAIAALAERQVHSVDSVATQHTHQTNEMGSEDRQTYANICNDSIQGVDGTHSVVGDEDGVAELLSVYATPARSHTQSERDEDVQGDQSASLDSKSEQEEERERPTWMEPQDSNTLDRESRDQGLNNWIEVSLENGRALSPHVCEESRDSISDWMLDHSSEAVEAGTSFSSSVPSASELPWEAPDIPPVQNIGVTEAQGFVAPPLMVPESFEEQMMLAMALSLAEAQALAHPR